MKALLEIDRQIFLFINHLPYINALKFVTPFLDSLMVFLSTIGSGALVWLVLGAVTAWFKKKRGLKAMIDFLFPLFLSLALSGILTNLILKPLVGRLRPNFVILKTRVLGRVLDDFSFPSGHATSSFAAAFVLGSSWVRKRKFKIDLDLISGVSIGPLNVRPLMRFLPLILFYLLALLISFSRIYIGVHYPSDVLIGAVSGLAIGKISIIIDKRIIK